MRSSCCNSVDRRMSLRGGGIVVMCERTSINHNRIQLWKARKVHHSVKDVERTGMDL